MPECPPATFGGLASSLAVGSPVALSRSRLTVRVHEEREPPYLEVRSRLDPRQSFVVSLGHRPVLEGLSGCTSIGRVHAICWGLAFGAVEPPAGAVVRFGSETLRFRSSAEAGVTRLAGPYWVADVEGVFRGATLVVADREVCSMPLADHW